MKLIPMVVLAALLTSACGNEILVVHDSQTTPASFTVIPYVTIPENAMGAYKVFNDNKADVDFAATVERELSQRGLKIYERPAFKYQHETTPAQGEKGETSSQMLDVVSMYTDTPADYVVVTYKASQRVRIIKKADKTLVATILLDGEGEQNADRIHGALAAAGVLKDAWGVNKCVVVKP